MYPGQSLLVYPLLVMSMFPAQYQVGNVQVFSHQLAQVVYWQSIVDVPCIYQVDVPCIVKCTLHSPYIVNVPCIVPSYSHQLAQVQYSRSRSSRGMSMFPVQSIFPAQPMFPAQPRSYMYRYFSHQLAQVVYRCTLHSKCTPSPQLAQYRAYVHVPHPMGRESIFPGQPRYCIVYQLFSLVSLGLVQYRVCIDVPCIHECTRKYSLTPLVSLGQYYFGHIL